jgi:hypothetical protein
MIDSRASLTLFAIGFALTSGAASPLARQIPVQLSQSGPVTPVTTPTTAPVAGPVLLRPRRLVNPVPEVPQIKPAMAAPTPNVLGPTAPTDGRGWAPVEVQMLGAVDNDSVGVITGRSH